MKNKGFTLVELLAVIAILALLVIIALPNVLSMFNGAKKDTFLTEAKNIYKEISKKYISETMRGNKINNISNDNNKLDLESNNLKYNIELDDFGNIKRFQVSNGTYCISGKYNNLGELTTDKIKEGECKEINPKSFSTDSWETIVEAVKEGITSKYKVGDTKTIDLGSYGTHTVRVSNTSTPSECSNTGFSQTACGFVIEFADIITTHKINTANTNKGGWESSEIRTFINNDIYNSLPTALKDGIINTTVVSGHGSKDTDNFTSTDKLYLLSLAEVFIKGTSGSIDTDSAKDLTRQLDYYKEKGVTTSSYSGAIKKNGTAASWWWLRSTASSTSNYFHGINTNGDWNSDDAFNDKEFSPAFRIG